MNLKTRAFVAGAVGMVVAFGLTELIHGLYQPVPSVLMAIAQQIIRLTPGGFATKAIETLGKADTPILIIFVVVATLLTAALLAYLGLIRSWVIALAGVGILAAVALVAAFAQPFVAPVATVLTVVGALGIGSAVSGFLLRASGFLTSKSVVWPASTESDGNEPPPRDVRSREAHSVGGIAVNRRNFLVLSGGAVLVGALLAVRAEDAAVAIVEEAVHGRDRALEREHDLVHRDLLGPAGQDVAAVRAARGAHELGLLEQRGDPLEVGEGKALRLGDRLQAHGGATALQSELDQQPDAVLRLGREEHDR